jgi:hypothetical protein
MITQQLRHWTQHPHTAMRRAGPRLGRPVAVAAVVTCALLSFARAAFASIPVPPPGGQYGSAAGSPNTITRVITTGGMPGWQITLIALGAALVAAAAAVILASWSGQPQPAGSTPPTPTEYPL